MAAPSAAGGGGDTCAKCAVKPCGTFCEDCSRVYHRVCHAHPDAGDEDDVHAYGVKAVMEYRKSRASAAGGGGDSGVIPCACGCGESLDTKGLFNVTLRVIEGKVYDQFCAFRIVHESPVSWAEVSGFMTKGITNIECFKCENPLSVAEMDIWLKAPTWTSGNPPPNPKPMTAALCGACAGRGSQKCVVATYEMKEIYPVPPGVDLEAAGTSYHVKNHNLYINQVGKETIVVKGVRHGDSSDDAFKTALDYEALEVDDLVNHM